MFYDARKNDHGLPHDPFKAIVAPRPIGWITSMKPAGDINLAPYSFFNGVSSRPADRDVLQRRPEGFVAFIERDRRIRLQSGDLGSARGDEPDLGADGARRQRDGSCRARGRAVAAWSSRRASPPRPARWNAAAADRAAERPRRDARSIPMSCSARSSASHIDDRFIKDGLLDTAAMKPIARCGYHNYAVVESQFSHGASDQQREPRCRCCSPCALIINRTSPCHTARSLVHPIIVDHGEMK